MKKCTKSDSGMTLVEVTLAIGILVYCGVSLMGMLPIMLNSMRESREATIMARIYQAVSSEVQENAGKNLAPWFFNQEGLQTTNGDYKATTNAPVSADLGGGVTNSDVRMVLFTLENTSRHTTNLVRPIFVTYVGTN